MTTIKPFKSERAAKMAYTKAEKAWEAARSKTCNYYGRTIQDPNNTKDSSEIFADLRVLEAQADALFEEMREVYCQARSQNFWVKSWHFGCNVTRDLIQANMD